ncbi:DUF3943 domain-containing protein [Cystobacter ferrugineus]|uniref:DUF3943 domain-containing protein n=1 Tax=Cystobacter ferrugineus TaxID=83449 RepID=A0A1L9BB18_9BACT|nr:DUF3943 domain-containing protein [Cystobacter ferrugineus]OJH39462.1 hypothetical protein BON30_18350 [Cystobacter ferrugineus]
MAVRGGTLMAALLVTWGTLGHAAEVPPAALPEAAKEQPPREQPPADAPLRRSYLVPAFEAAAFNIGLFSFHNLITREPFAVISWETTRGHFDGTHGWTFDVDQFITNQFGHPYHGSLIYNFARSSGMPFWRAGLYNFVASLGWEYFAENEAPAINDQITTTLGGMFLGEVLYRTYRAVIPEGGGRVSPLRRLTGLLLSPGASLNDWLLGGEVSSGDIDSAPPLSFVLTPGVSLMTRLEDRTATTPRLLLEAGPQVSLAAELTYGALGDPTWRYRYPFSYFDASAGLTFPGIIMGNLYIRGLLLGGQYGGLTSPVKGLWGLFGLYDFGANNIVRVSSVGLGLGTTVQTRLGQEVFLQSSAILGGLGFAAAGSLGLESLLVRDYHIGPGVEGILEAKLVRRGLGMLRMRARHWWVTGVYAEPRDGFESITYVTLDGRVRLSQHLALGLELPLSQRSYDFGPDATRTIGGGGARITLSFMPDDAFGVAGP